MKRHANSHRSLDIQEKGEILFTKLKILKPPIKREIMADRLRTKIIAEQLVSPWENIMIYFMCLCICEGES